MEEDNDRSGLGGSFDGSVYVDAMSGVTAVFECLFCLEATVVLVAVLSLEGFVELDEGHWDVIVPLVASLHQYFLDSLHFDQNASYNTQDNNYSRVREGGQ